MDDGYDGMHAQTECLTILLSSDGPTPETQHACTLKYVKLRENNLIEVK